MTSLAPLRVAQCPHCRKMFAWDGGHTECTECRYPALLARQGYGYEDVAVKAKISKKRAKAIVFRRRP